MAHYFDDIMHRHTNPSKPQKPQMRRSSTARSMGARSDFNSVNGEDLDARSEMAEDPEREAQRKEADAHLHKYIADQLQRVADDDEYQGVADKEEYEATP